MKLIYGFLFCFLLIAQDPRYDKLHAFLRGRPADQYCEHFLSIADSYQLDWRLLPALSIIESSGGKNCHGNNWFGWNSGKAKFSDPEQGIDTVAFSLAFGNHYCNKDFWTQMHKYNPHSGYGSKVYKYMLQIDSGLAVSPLARKKTWRRKRRVRKGLK